MLSFGGFKEALARAAAYMCHGRAAAVPGAHPLVAQLRRLCETLVASAGGVRKPAAAAAPTVAAVAPSETVAPFEAAAPAAAAHAAPSLASAREGGVAWDA